ncbi:hypothetical protein K402DRAFT_240024 [Aulographum hederae CBS 113979]|uniref:Uncharacterized protein n=1 Tax=Aulographum hederae CBS 113979 TaxID=1176131 RepID=A0A6G1GK79_9PEZI|nr:hypothetical protein K402DRAFT_240024 [Aulographum hederae CBS 113979]
MKTVYYLVHILILNSSNGQFSQQISALGIKMLPKERRKKKKRKKEIEGKDPHPRKPFGIWKDHPTDFPIFPDSQLWEK